MTVTPAELQYVKDHHWIRPNDDGTVIRVGVTDFAQESLGDVVAIYLPRENQRVQAGEACGEIESTKSVNDLVAPLSGTITARNTRMEDEPEVVNEDPYGEGWLFEITLSEPPYTADAPRLITADEYKTFTGK
jgi:glycine cleavage system H protein